MELPGRNFTPASPADTIVEVSSIALRELELEASAVDDKAVEPI